MTRDEMVLELAVARKAFDDKVAALPAARLTSPIPGSTHTVAEIVSHVTAYDRLIVERLIAARHGAGTSFVRDSEGWEAFNVQTWADAAGADPQRVLANARESFEALQHEVGRLSDEELNAAIGATASLDHRWLQNRPPWKAIAIDSSDHYGQHYAALDAAIAASASGS